MLAARFGAAFGLCLCALARLILASSEDGAGWMSQATQHWLSGGSRHASADGGLWWYLLSLAFGSLRGPFVAAFHVLPRLCIPCLAIALPPSRPGTPPLLATALAVAILAATKRHPSVPEMVTAIAFVGAQLDSDLLHRCRLLPVATAALVVGTVASRILIAAWLDHHQLNANFAYAATVVAGGGLLVLAYDVAAAALHVRVRRG